MNGEAILCTFVNKVPNRTIRKYTRSKQKKKKETFLLGGLILPALGAVSLVGAHSHDLRRRRALPLHGVPLEREERGAGEGAQVQGVLVVVVDGDYLHGARVAARLAGAGVAGVVERAGGAGPLLLRRRPPRAAPRGRLSPRRGTHGRGEEEEGFWAE